VRATQAGVCIDLCGLASNILQLINITKSFTLIIQGFNKSASGFSSETERFRSTAKLVRKDLDNLLDPNIAQKAPGDELR
jgi:hypothetical protein